MGSPRIEGPFEVAPQRPPRYQTELYAVVTFRTAQGENRILARVLNTSVNGMAVSIPAHIDVGSMIELEVNIPNLDGYLHFDAIVRHRNQFVYGVAFQNAGEQQRKDLAQFCATLPQVAPRPS